MNHLFIEAATLMLVGMGFVYAFLALLILMIKWLLTPLSKKYPDPIVPVKRKNSSKHSKIAEGIQPAVVAAISGAITQYRQQHTKP